MMPIRLPFILERLFPSFRESRITADAIRTDDIAPVAGPEPMDLTEASWDVARRYRTIVATVTLWERRVRERSDEGRRFRSTAIQSRDGLGWRYADIDRFEWCGATAAWLQARANGVPLSDRKPHWSSCYRLVHRRPEALGAEYKPRPGREAQPGDVVIVGREPESKPGRRSWGQHITTVVAIDEDGAWCIGGNQIGVGPRGHRFEGVTLTHYRWERRVPGDVSVMYVVPVLEAGCDESIRVIDDGVDPAEFAELVEREFAKRVV